YDPTQDDDDQQEKQDGAEGATEAKPAMQNQERQHEQAQPDMGAQPGLRGADAPFSIPLPWPEQKFEDDDAAAGDPEAEPRQAAAAGQLALGKRSGEVPAGRDHQGRNDDPNPAAMTRKALSIHQHDAILRSGRVVSSLRAQRAVKDKS